jgi:hypothetical protein
VVEHLYLSTAMGDPGDYASGMKDIPNSSSRIGKQFRKLCAIIRG